MWYALIITGIVALVLVVVVFLQARQSQRKSGSLIDVFHKHPNIYHSMREPSSAKSIPSHRKLNPKEFKQLLGEILDEDEMLLITLHKYDDLSLGEISFIVGLSEEEVFRAYQALQGKIKKMKK